MRANHRRAAILAISLLAAACGGGGVGSVGAVFGRDNDTHALYVRDVPRGLGAEEAGLVPGDQVVMIDGFYVRDLTVKEIRTRLRGDIGSTVALTILRGDEVRHLRVARSALREPEAVQPREQKISE